MNNTQTQDRESPGELTFTEIYLTVSGNLRKILAISAIAGIITALLVFFVVSPLFLSTATVKTSGKIVGLSIPEMPDLSGIGDLAGINSASKELALYENIILSNRCLIETITKFNLNEDFDYMQDAVKSFKQNNLVIEKDKIAGTMNIGVYDKDPAKSREIVEFLVSRLNFINIDLNRQNARNQREFIEERYIQAENDMRNAEDSVRIYQDQYGVLPDAQIRATSQTELDLEAQIRSEEIKLELLKKIISPDQSEVKMAEDKIGALKKELDDIRNSTDNRYKLKLKGQPEMLLNFYRLVAEVDKQKKILTILLPIYESSKIEEKREIPTILVLDNPLVPEKKSKPKRLTTVAIVSLVAFVLSASYFILRKKWRQFKSTLPPAREA